MKRFLVVLVPLALLGGLFASTGFLVAAQRAKSALEQALAAEAQARVEAACLACAPDSSVSCCVSALPITEEQTKAMLAACSDRCDELPALEKASEDALARLDAALAEMPVDRAKVDAALSALSEARAKELKARVDAILLVRDVLAPEQIEQLGEMLRGR